MAQRKAVPAERSGEAEAAARPVLGRAVVLGVIAATVAAALLVWHDATSTGAVISVPSAASMPRPTNAAAARHGVLAFLPSGASLTVAQAISAVTATPVASLAGRARVARLPGGTWSVQLAVPVNEAALLKTGRIFAGVGQGASNLKSGLLQVTDGSVEYVIHTGSAGHEAVFDFRLAKGGQTLSATNWNANTVLSQTQIGNQDIP